MNKNEGLIGLEQAMALGKMVPGFDFLQGLASSAVKGASQALPTLPNLGGWIAPTLSVEELDKRIAELRAVQFWLDQNATALKATIQALEVQKMTLSTLQGMNVQLGDLAQAFQMKPPSATQHVASSPTPASSPSPAPASQPSAAKPSPRASPRAKPKASSTASAASAVADPLQWWGSLTQQFQQIANSALREAAQKAASNTAREVARGAAGGVARQVAGGASAAAKAVGSVARSRGATAPPASPRKPTAGRSSKASR